MIAPHQLWEDRLKYTRWERQVRMYEEAQLPLDSVPRAKAVPLNLAIPLLQGGSLEEDDSLQDRCIRLLVNAADASAPFEVRLAFASILENLSPLDAEALDMVYSVAHGGLEMIVTGDLPTSVAVTDGDTAPLVDPPLEVQESLSNLDRLGCVALNGIGGEAFPFLTQTAIGTAFVRACRRAA